ncbi:MAG: aldehyde dehydrogenase [Actinomycetota bacterium]|nr:aldehyde dehydrogenase family protein [Actinomycetota bacterium]
MREYELLIDGKLVGAHGGHTVATRNPATNDYVSIVPKTAVRDARRAVDAARRTANSGAWSGAGEAERRRALRGLADVLWERQTEIADVDSEEAGIPIRACSAIVAGAIESLRSRADTSHAREATRDTPEPFGVVGVIAGFDAPFVRALGRVANALADGNAVVLNPSPATPGSALELARACAESDVPPGVLNVLSGGDHRVNEEIATNPLVDSVAVAGSVDAAMKIVSAAATVLRPIDYAPSGSATQFIFPDADLDLAIPGALWAALFLSGQTPHAATRIVVHASIHEVVEHHLAQGARSLRAGDPSSFETDLGPMLTVQAGARAGASIEKAVSDGARILCGGSRSGSVFQPTVLGGVTSVMRIAHEDVHAPVVSVLSLRDFDDAAALASAEPPAVIWSRDAAGATDFAARLRTPDVWVNCFEHFPSGYKRDVRVKRIHRVEGRQQTKVQLPLLGLDRLYGYGAES